MSKKRKKKIVYIILFSLGLLASGCNVKVGPTKVEANEPKVYLTKLSFIELQNRINSLYMEYQEFSGRSTDYNRQLLLEIQVLQHEQDKYR